MQCERQSGRTVDPESTDPESTDPESSPPESSTTLLPAPLAPVPPLFDEEKVQNAVDQLDDIVNGVMDDTGVPGIAVGVVYEDEVILAEGFGVRRVGEPETVDADTVFQVASVSKPVASTIVPGVVGQDKANWTDPVVTWNPEFALSDPYVTANATLADLLSHRSGLYEGSGDLLEDLGWDPSTSSASSTSNRSTPSGRRTTTATSASPRLVCRRPTRWGRPGRTSPIRCSSIRSR